MSSRRTTSEQRINLFAASDQMLLELTRDGMRDAFGELWSRHHGSVLATVRSYTGYDPNDLMQESFLKVYSHVRAGRGLPISFRAYVATTARRLAIDKSRQDKGVIHDQFEEEYDHDSLSVEDFSERVLDDSTTGQAFKALASGQREVLWYRDVEDLPVQEIARLVGMTPNATTVFIKRARDAFKTAWISVQLSPSRALPDACKAIVPKLAAYARDKTSSADTGKIDLHLLDCAHCAALTSEANDLHKKLALALLPLLLLGGAPAYLEWIQSGKNRTPLPASANWVNVTINGSRRTPVGARFRALNTRRVTTVTLAAAASLLIVGAAAIAALRQAETDIPSVASPAPQADANTSVDARAAFDREAGTDQNGSGDDAGRESASQSIYTLIGSHPSVTDHLTITPEPNSPLTNPAPSTPADDTPPVEEAPTYPEYRATTTSIPSIYLGILEITATPNATLIIRVSDKWGNSAGEVTLVTDPETGYVVYDFPEYEGSVVTLEIFQEYATPDGIVREASGHTVSDFSIPGR